MITVSARPPPPSPPPLLPCFPHKHTQAYVRSVILVPSPSHRLCHRRRRRRRRRPLRTRQRRGPRCRVPRELRLRAHDEPIWLIQTTNLSERTRRAHRHRTCPRWPGPASGRTMNLSSSFKQRTCPSEPVRFRASGRARARAGGLRWGRVGAGHSQQHSVHTAGPSEAEASRRAPADRSVFIGRRRDRFILISHRQSADEQTASSSSACHRAGSCGSVQPHATSLSGKAARCRAGPAGRADDEERRTRDGSRRPAQGAVGGGERCTPPKARTWGRRRCRRGKGTWADRKRASRPNGRLHPSAGPLPPSGVGQVRTRGADSVRGVSQVSGKIGNLAVGAGNRNLSRRHLVCGRPAPPGHA